MTIRGFRRRRHRGERGVTMIELLVTIAIMTIGFVSVISAFSAIEIGVGSISKDAQLTSLVREVGDYIQSERFAYITCDTGAAYDTQLQSAITARPPSVIVPAGYTAKVILVAQASGGSHVVSGVSSSLIPIGGCSGSAHDFGVQQIEFQVSAPGHTAARILYTRIVYKRWN